MTPRPEGTPPPRSQSKCHTSRAPSTSHSKEECPCAADGRAGWVPTISHSPTKISNCVSELVGCGGSSSEGLLMDRILRGHASWYTFLPPARQTDVGYVVAGFDREGSTPCAW